MSASIDQGGMDPAARRFLQQACLACQDHDREGQATLPNSVWRLLLEDLNLEQDSDAVYFLTDHLQAAGEGYFSYTPLLQVLGAALPEEMRGQDPNSPVMQGQGPAPDRVPSYDQDVVDAGDAQRCYNMPGPHAMQPLHQLPPMPRQPPAHDEQAMYAGGSIESLPPRAGGSIDSMPPTSPQGGSMIQDFYSEAGSAWDEGEEDFWRRRGAAIKALFTRWDCNQLSNEIFTQQMQDTLGDRVDVTSEESDFQRKTNQHRCARNLKFAALMSALRRDAQATSARMKGLPLPSSRASAYEPSEIGSEALSHAAGRPSSMTAHLNSRNSGRRQYTGGSEGGLIPVLSSMDAVPCAGGSAASERSYAPSERPYAPSEGYGNQASVGTQGGRPQQLAPYAWQSGDNNSVDGAPPISKPRSPDNKDSAGAPLSQRGSLSEQALWSRGGGAGGASVPPYADDRCEVMSLSGMTDAASVTESHASKFTQRNREGHGNILTWGTDSRSITPSRARQVPQVTADPEWDGPVRSRGGMSSSIFDPRR